MPARLLDHLVGAGKDCRRKGQSESLRRLEVDDQLKLRGLEHRQIGRLGAMQDSPDIVSGLPETLCQICAIAHEAACPDVLAK